MASSEPVISAPEPMVCVLPELHVMTAGLPRKGKSTGLNNIFDLNFKAKLSARPVTEKVVTVKIEKNGISLNVTDTPGLKAADANQDECTLQDMKKVGENTVLLLLTLPVTSSSCITQDYCNIVKNLTTILGPEIWNWCLILLTFSDSVRKDEFPSVHDQQDYQDYLKEHCNELQKVLVKIGVKKQVNLFFEYTSFEQFENESLDGIVAIPVGKVPDIPTEKLFPLQRWTHEYKWTDLAFMEIAKLSREVRYEEKLKVTRKIEEANELRSALLQFKYGCVTIEDIVEAGMEGAAQGARAGAQLGEHLGPIVGAFVGAKYKSVGIRQGKELGREFGSIVGAITGALGVGGFAAVVLIVRSIKEKKKIREIEQKLCELEQS